MSTTCINEPLWTHLILYTPPTVCAENQWPFQDGDKANCRFGMVTMNKKAWPRWKGESDEELDENTMIAAEKERDFLNIAFCLTPSQRRAYVDGGKLYAP